MKNKMTRSIKYSTTIIFLQCAAPEQQQQFLWAGMWDDFHRLCAHIQQMQSWIFQISQKYINFVCSRYHHQHRHERGARALPNGIIIYYFLCVTAPTLCCNSQRSNILTSKRTITIRFPIAAVRSSSSTMGRSSWTRQNRKCTKADSHFVSRDCLQFRSCCKNKTGI